MVDVYSGPFAGVVTPAGICVQTSQDNIITEANKVRDLFIAPVKDELGGVVSQPHPDFDQIPEHTRDKIIVEMNALTAAIDAMAIA